MIVARVIVEKVFVDARVPSGPGADDSEEGEAEGGEFGDGRAEEDLVARNEQEAGEGEHDPGDPAGQVGVLEEVPRGKEGVDHAGITVVAAPSPVTRNGTP